MCGFFSFRSNGRGTYLYFNAKEREEIRLSGEGNPDSHTFIAHKHGYTGRRDDTLHRYEYDPFTETFTVDTIVDCIPDDREDAERWVRGLDWSKIDSTILERLERAHAALLRVEDRIKDRARVLNVGDKCRIRTREEMEDLYPNLSVMFGWNSSMDYLCGSEFTIRTIDFNGHYYSVEEIETGWSISIDMLEKVS